MSPLLAFLFAAELVNQRTHQPRHSCIQLRDQVRAALGAIDLFVDPKKYFFDLLVQFGSVSDDQYPRIFHVLANPLRKPHHRQALARPLGIPNDATLAALHMGLRGAHAEILAVAAEFFCPSVEDDEVVDQLQKSGLAAQLNERPVQQVFDGAVFLPSKVIVPQLPELPPPGSPILLLLVLVRWGLQLLVRLPRQCALHSVPHIGPLSSASLGASVSSTSGPPAPNPSRLPRTPLAAYQRFP
jgi:hypothetical protein